MSNSFSTEQAAEVAAVVKLHLGQEWKFELQDGKKNMYAHPDFERKCVVICKQAFEKHGADWAKKVAFSVVATQVAVRSGKKLTSKAVERAYETMKIGVTDRMHVRFK